MLPRRRKSSRVGNISGMDHVPSSFAARSETLSRRDNRKNTVPATVAQLPQTGREVASRIPPINQGGLRVKWETLPDGALQQQQQQPPQLHHRIINRFYSTVRHKNGDAMVVHGNDRKVRIKTEENSHHHHLEEDPLPSRPPTADEMNACFQMCRGNQWNSVLNCIKNNPLIPVTSMIMDNHISTTILHQAITSKGETKARSRVILEILEVAPGAASIKNGYGSLPLHVIAQRNTKMDATTKEMLISKLVSADQSALVQQGGVGLRTPLHIIFTDYISPRLTKIMIQAGPQACFMKDRKGYLPAHVACSRHCSPEKLQMLLNVNPASLFAKTNQGHTLLSLATSTATKSHPNYALIDDLRRRLDYTGAQQVGHHPLLPSYDVGGGDDHHTGPNRVSSDDTYDHSDTFVGEGSPSSTMMPVPASSAPLTRSRKRKVAPEKKHTNSEEDDDDNEQANLLLHFYRQTDLQIGGQQIKNFAKV